MTSGATTCCARTAASPITAAQPPVVDVPTVATPFAADAALPVATPPSGTTFLPAAPQPAALLPQPMPDVAQQPQPAAPLPMPLPVTPVPQPAATPLPEPMAFPVQQSPQLQLQQTPALQQPPATVPNAPAAGPLPEPMPVGAAAPQPQPKPGTAAWLASWPAARGELQKIGLPQAIIDCIGREPMTQRDLTRTVQDMEQKLRGNRHSRVLTPLSGGAGQQAAGAPDSTPGRTGYGAQASQAQGGAAAPQAKQQAQLQAEAQRIVAKHAKLGVPKEILDAIEQNSATPSGLDATLTQLEGRMDKLRTDGWVDRFAKAGGDKSALWQLALGGNPDQGTIFGPPPKDDQLAMALVYQQRSKAGWTKQGLEAAVSLIPGVQAAEYVAGKNVITGSDIRRHDGINQILAAGSAIALGVLALGKFHNVKSMLSGLTMARDGYRGIEQAAGHAVSADSQAGKLRTLAQAGKLTPLKAYFDKNTRNSLIGVGNIEAGARARTALGARLDPIGHAVSGDIIGRVATGDLTATAGKLTTRTLGGRGVQTVHNAAQMSADAIAFNSKLRIGNGSSQLVSMVKAGGEHMAADNAYLADRLPHLSHNIAQLSEGERSGVGETLAGMTLRTTGKVGRDGVATRDLNKMVVEDPGSPALAWYRAAAAQPRG